MNDELSYLTQKYLELEDKIIKESKQIQAKFQELGLEPNIEVSNP